MGKRVKVVAHCESVGVSHFGGFFGKSFTYSLDNAYHQRKSLLRAMRRHADRMGFDVDWSKCNG